MCQLGYDINICPQYQDFRHSFWVTNFRIRKKMTSVKKLILIWARRTLKGASTEAFS
jgi:hypothetical protein